ncbi:MAG TPA: COX15/CtaA family protein [Candidatus Acidoferrales bacterium]|nr:COX15/CtaA family protein [Candidatus Acidoferrales bacterium]
MREAGNPALHRFAVLTAFCTFLLIIAGALVTSNQAGLSIPTWPFAYGTVFPPMVGGIRWEWSHRLAAATVAILTSILAVFIWLRESRHWVRILGVAAFLLVVAQALLGRFTVKTFLDPPVSAAHATLAELFFIVTVSLAVFTGKWWVSDVPQLHDEESPRLFALALATSCAILVQIVLGAAFRHNAFGIIPHLIGAVVVTGMVFWTVLAAATRFRKVRDLRAAARYLEILLGLQILLGGAAYWAVLAARDAVQPTPLYVIITVAHVAVGALTFAASVFLTLRCYRILKPSHEAHAEASTQRVPS